MLGLRLPTPTPLDTGLAVAAVAAVLGEVAVRGDAAIGAGSVALALAIGAPLLWLSRAPVVVLIVELALIVVSLATLDTPRAAVGIGVVTVSAVAYYGDRRRSLVLAVAMAPVVAGIVAVNAAGEDGLATEIVINSLLVLAAVALGDALRSRRTAVDATRARERQERDAATRQLVDGERLRLAHELHDSIAHALVAINTRAGVAAHLHDRRPGDALAALEDIKHASADALSDLRSTLGRLRDPGGAPLRPSTRTLQDIEPLVKRARAAGLDVRLEQSGAAADLAPAIQHAGYRIVQESLTNVVRHAQATAADVRVSLDDETLRIDVSDDGEQPNGAGDGWGQGLRGMAERARALGGQCQAGPRAGGGWLVAARLPRVPESE